MVGTSVKKTTFKQRVRKNDLKQRHKFGRDLSKRARLGRRVSNRFDRIATSSRPMEEMISEIAQGMAIPSQEVIDDPRSLADMLLPRQPASSSSSSAVQATHAARHNTHERAAHQHAGARQHKDDDVAYGAIASKSQDEERSRRLYEVSSGSDSDESYEKSASVSSVADSVSSPHNEAPESSALSHTSSTGTALSSPAAIPLALPDPREVEARERARLHSHDEAGKTNPLQHGGLTYSSSSSSSWASGAGGTLMSTQPKNQYRHHGQPYLFWERLGLHPLLLRALRELHFTHPTPVQEKVLPTVLLDAGAVRPSSSSSTCRKSVGKTASARRGEDAGTHDMVVSAETGSGKTLVFALPILHDILQRMDAHLLPGDSSAACDGGDTESTRAAEGNEGRTKRARGETAAKKDATLQDKQRRVVVAAAESTGTATDAPPSRDTDFATRIMFALILSPTRELALQIDTMMHQLTRFCAPAISIGCVVGGMAAEKQQRVLNRHPHILIATPGRLWELVQNNEGCYLGHSISRRLHYVVLDEADKMLESGRFAELHQLLERIHCETLPSDFSFTRSSSSSTAAAAPATDDVLEAGYWDAERQKFVPMSQAKGMHDENKSTALTAPSPATSREEERRAKKATRLKRGAGVTKRKRCEDEDEQAEDDHDHDADDDGSAPNGAKMAGWRNKDQPRPMTSTPAAPSEGHCVRTYVTSATLSLQTNYERRDYKSKKSIIRTSNADVMNKVLQQLQMKVSSARTFSIVPEHGVAAKINETYLRCAEESKDLYLYYFLKTYRDERTIVFVNAISMLRRIVKLLEVLGIAVVGLHASMQQRQRLKFIDKFKHGAAKVLVATDVASRGLDIDGLKYVVHLQVPRSTDAYIHRCGRTARCGGTGLSLLLVNATEHVSFHKLMESLGRKESDIEVFALQPTVVHQLHRHVRIALQIDKLQKEIDKSRARNQWATRASKEAELEVDDMYDDEADQVNLEKLKAIKLLKRELDLLTRKFTGSFGGKGAFRTGAHALGVKAAEEKLQQRAKRQTLRLRK